MNSPAQKSVQVDSKSVTLYHVSGMPTCDNCSLYFEEPKPGCGRVVLTAFQTSWTAYWSNLTPGESAEARFMSEPAEELVRSFQYGTPKILPADRFKEAGYLHHMVEQVRQHMRDSGVF